MDRSRIQAHTTVIQKTVIGTSQFGAIALATLPHARALMGAPEHVAYRLQFGWDNNEALFTVTVALRLTCVCECVVCGLPCDSELAVEEQLYLLEDNYALARHQHLVDVHVCGGNSLNHVHLIDEQICLYLPAHPTHDNCTISAAS